MVLTKLKSQWRVIRCKPVRVLRIGLGSGNCTSAREYEARI